jgi:hypothetical protein
MSNVRREYPPEALELLGRTFDQTKNTQEAVSAVLKKFPQRIGKLTCKRSYSAIATWRRRQKKTGVLVEKLPTCAKVSWDATSELAKAAIFKDAAVLFDQHIRWSAIRDRLMLAYPQIILPKPGNLAMLFFRANPTLRPKGKRTYTLSGKPRKNGKNNGILLSITKDGQEVISMAISAETCGRVIAQILGE